MDQPDFEITDAYIESLLAHKDKVVSALAREVRALREGIKHHRAQTGHSLCWINDVELWKLVEADPAYPHHTLPVRDEFLANCRAFYESRLKHTPWEDPPVQKTIVDDE
jgi:hypothetical protein